MDVNPQEQNEETYESLISLIENSQGRLAPIVVACDDWALRQRVIDRYEIEAREAKILPFRVVLGREPSVRSALAKLKDEHESLRQGKEAVFTVTGAETLLRVTLKAEDEQSELDKFFGYLQWTREGLREFRYPIVLWVTYRILKEMSRRAPDFWSWRKAVLRFKTEDVKTEDVISKPTILENVQASSITVGDITETINYQQRPRSLSTTIDSALPPIAHWQERAEEGSIAGYFDDAQVRLVGISAASGYGKSALAAQLYKQAIGFDKKLWANFQEPANFGTFGRWLIAQLLGEERYAQVRETYERDADAELIVKALNLLTQNRHLLILDNLETLFQSAELWQPYGEFLDKWLGRGGGGVILLTSQIKLELPTATWRWETLKGLAIDQGVALLQAQQIQGELADLRAFVELADGHPLLLQLTASLLRREQAANYEPATIYRLERNDVTLLREIRERHRDVGTSVGDLLDRAFDRLYPPHLQVLLLRLSVLRQRFGVAAAQAMIEKSIDLSDLRKLVRSSFLQEQRQGEDWWFEFLPLIQRYLRQRAGQELSIAHAKAIGFFWDHRQPWTGALEDCRPQLEAFYHLCELGQYASAYQAIDTCFNLLNRAGYYTSLVPVYERLAQEWQASDDAETQNLGWAWTRLGNIYRTLGRVQDAIAAHQQAQQKFQSIADRQGEAASLSNLGLAYQSLGQYPKAIDFHQQSLAIEHEIGNRQGEASSLGSLGNAYRSLGQYPQAIDFLQQHLSIAREIGDRQGEANALGSLGIAYRLLGQYPQAIDFHQQSLAIEHEIGNRQGEANALGNLGNAYRSLGQYPQAIDFHQQHLSIAREIGDRQGEANSLFNQALALAKIDQQREALDKFQQAKQLYAAIGLAHDVEDCEQEINEINQVIEVESRT